MKQRRHTTDAVEQIYGIDGEQITTKISCVGCCARSRKQDIIFHTVAPNYNYDAADEFFSLFIRTNQKVVRFAGTPPHTQRFVILLWFNTSTRCSHWGVVHAVDKRRTCCIHFVFIKLFRFVLSTALMSISSKCFHFARYFFSLSPTENLFLLLENKNIFRSLETGEWNRLYCCCRLLDGALFLLSSLFLGNVRCGLWAMGGARLNHTWETERLLRFSAYLKIPIWMAS